MKLHAYALAAVLAGAIPAFAQDFDSAALSDQGQRAYDRKEFALAGMLFLQAADKDPSRVIDFYNASCSFALAGNKGEAFKTLDRTCANGCGNISQLKVDSDFASIRSDSRWADIEKRVAELRNRVGK